jgi:hypothetical protein
MIRFVSFIRHWSPTYGDRDTLEDLDVYGVIILNWIVKKSFEG